MIATPVGMRCRECAGLRRLPQFDVDAALLARSGVAGLAVSTAAWFAVSYIAYLGFFAAILVGFAVAAAMSTLAKRRTSRSLEAMAVCAVVLGLFIAWWVRFAVLAGLSLDTLSLNGIVLPAVLASFIAVVRLRLIAAVHQVYPCNAATRRASPPGQPPRPRPTSRRSQSRRSTS